MTILHTYFTWNTGSFYRNVFFKIEILAWKNLWIFFWNPRNVCHIWTFENIKKDMSNVHGRRVNSPFNKEQEIWIILVEKSRNWTPFLFYMSDLRSVIWQDTSLDTLTLKIVREIKKWPPFCLFFKIADPNSRIIHISCSLLKGLLTRRPWTFDNMFINHHYS